MIIRLFVIAAIVSVVVKGQTQPTQPTPPVVPEESSPTASTASTGSTAESTTSTTSTTSSSSSSSPTTTTKATVPTDSPTPKLNTTTESNENTTSAGSSEKKKEETYAPPPLIIVLITFCFAHLAGGVVYACYYKYTRKRGLQLTKLHERDRIVKTGVGVGVDQSSGISQSSAVLVTAKEPHESDSVLGAGKVASSGRHLTSEVSSADTMKNVPIVPGGGAGEPSAIGFGVSMKSTTKVMASSKTAPPSVLNVSKKGQ